MITLKNVSKRYQLSDSVPYYSLRDAVSGILKHPFQKKKEFWAVKDVSFSLGEGEKLGIIGRNGAGKSTLLKLISRITPISEGEIRLEGRVASLLEVGTGFHPELSGRENIFLNGAILGMKWFEIRKKFDEIVDFAEVSAFLDTPVKYYSSGMFVRLAFSVAAHLDSEIMIIDEVLSVGDVGFQKKCMDKMEELTKSGRTLLFVSHNISAVEKLCSSVILMENGRSEGKLKTSQGIRKYLNSLEKTLNLPLNKRTDRIGKGKIYFSDFSLENGKHHSSYGVGDNIMIKAQIESNYKETVPVRLALSVSTETDISLISCDSALKHETYSLKPGKSVIYCTIRDLRLNYGAYHINLAVFYKDEPEDWITPVAAFKVEYGTYDKFIPDEKYYPILASFLWSVSNSKA